MSTNALLVSCRPGGSIGFGTFGDTFSFVVGDFGSSTTAAATWAVPSPAGTFSKVGVNCTINGNGGTAEKIAIQKNGTTGNQNASLAAGVTGWVEDTSHTDSFSAGDTAVVIRTGGGFNNTTITTHRSQFNSSTPASLESADDESNSFAYSTGALFAALIGTWGNNGTESREQQKRRAAGTLANLTVHISSSNTGTQTIKLRKNTADGNQLISISSGTTGLASDASHTDSIASGDLVAVSGVSTASGGSKNFYSARMAGTISAQDLFAHTPGLINVGTVATYYEAVGGQGGSVGTESTQQIHAAFAFTASKLRLTVASNSGGAGGAGNLKFRVAGADGNQIASFTASATGTFEDVSHTDSVSSGAAINHKLSITAGAATLAIQDCAVLIDDGSNSGATTGTIAQTFTGISQSASGGQGEQGTIAQTFTGFSQAASGYIKPIGTIAQTFTGISQEAHGIGSPGAPRATQIVRLVPALGTPKGRSTQVGRFTVAGVTSKARSTQLARMVAATVTVQARASQLVRMIIAAAVPCGTTWCQCWRLTRRDGVIFRFTSLDEDFAWGSETFSACGSLNPSASESATALGQVGNIELTGIIASSAITAGDLYGGLFDDAFVEVWLVDYSGEETPKRIAAGWTGALSQEAEGSFKMEVIGPGARLQQQALVQTVAPRCRWKFGDTRCGIDREARSLSGEVLFSVDRGNFTAEIDPGTLSSGHLVSGAASSGADEIENQWENGTVRFESGSNTGQECEVKTVDFATGQIVLWALPANTPIAGDTFTLLPGCAQDKAACQLYANFDRFGGYPDVPGDDAIAQVPDATAS